MALAGFSRLMPSGLRRPDIGCKLYKGMLKPGNLALITGGRLYWGSLTCSVTLLSDYIPHHCT